jgi:ectoine hydroxylase-related dioxygenase (phytanoyl-CoA dioxygenase family)
MKKFSVLKDPMKNEILQKEGYVRLNVLDKAEIEAIKYYSTQQHNGEVISGLYVSATRLNKDKVSEISDFLVECLEHKVNQFIDEADILGGTFIIKGANTLDKLEPHQDWSIVDETHGRSYTLWIALEDTNDQNGALYMLPRSHEKFRGYRHFTIPSIYGKVYKKVWSYMVPIHLKAGEGVLFDHAIGHGSMPNLTGNDRIAVTCSLLTCNSSYRLYCLEDKNISEYFGEAEYYQTEAAKFGPGNLKKLRVLNMAPNQLSKWRLMAHYSRFNRILTCLRII